MNDIKKLRRLMRAAHAMQKSNPVILRGVPITQSQAVKYAWWFESFRLKLQNGIYRFSYFKTDGYKHPKGINSTKGALNSEALNRSEPAPGVFTYYDLEKKSWRSFKCENFIGFITKV